MAPVPVAGGLVGGNPVKICDVCRSEEHALTCEFVLGIETQHHDLCLTCRQKLGIVLHRLLDGRELKGEKWGEEA